MSLSSSSITSGQQNINSHSQELLHFMSKYVFERKGIQLGGFDSFWHEFLTLYPDFSFLDSTDLRLTFVCELMPLTYGTNIHGLPEEEYYYLKLGDYDPDFGAESDDGDETFEDSHETEKWKEDDLLVVNIQNLHRTHDSLDKIAKSLLAKNADLEDDSSDSD